MAREEHDREDLLREAVALVERCELELPGPRHVFAGFRADGCASVYFDGDPAWHFNTRGQLRRAFVAGLLYKAQGCCLIRLERRRTAEAVELVRHACTSEETAALLERASSELAELERTIASGNFRLLGQVPAEADVVERMRHWLAGLARPIPLAAVPNAR